MTERYDVAIVGARCAGSPLATLLAREGLAVVVLEQAQFPRDTLSSHVMQAPVSAFFAKLGVMSEIKATGARFVNQLDLRLGDARVLMPAPLEDGDAGGFFSVRRFLLDPILAAAASDAGAEVRFGTKVIGLVRERGRVTGVELADGTALHARLVIGADGRNSTVARLTGARMYNVTRSERHLYWGFFEAPKAPLTRGIVHRWDDRFVYGFPSDSGLFQVAASVADAQAAGWRGNLEQSLLAEARHCIPLGEALEGATLSGKVFGIRRWQGFFREPTGAGWVLAGDAGHFKDPAPGWGISDAVHQVDTLAPRIVAAWHGSDVALDRALRQWGRWRDRNYTDYYWLATDFGRAGPPALPVSEVIRQRGERESMGALFMHRRRPFQEVPRRRVVSATARLLARPGVNRRMALRDLRHLIVEDTQRQWRKVSPKFEPGDVATEVRSRSDRGEGCLENGERLR